MDDDKWIAHHVQNNHIVSAEIQNDFHDRHVLNRKLPPVKNNKGKETNTKKIELQVKHHKKTCPDTSPSQIK